MELFIQLNVLCLFSPSDTDSRLDLETQNKFSLTSCCMRTDLEVNSFLGDVK